MVAKINWFHDLTGLASDDPATVRAGISAEETTLVCRANGRRMQAGRLMMPSLAGLPVPPAGPNRLRVREVIGDVQALHRDPDNAGAVFQVASQFNLLEMARPDVTLEQGIARYAGDPTQGPACAMACAAGTIWRNYLVPVAGQTGQSAAQQLDMLADFGAALGNQDGQLWRMVNGYVRPQPGGLARVAKRLAGGNQAELRALVRVGVQRDTEVTMDNAGHLVSQVYCSALPVAYADERVDDWAPFARLILEAAYLATLAIAAENARLTGNRRLYLTRLGGGAFGNPARWTTDAMATALSVYASADLDVGIVSHRNPDAANLALLRG
ncbi:MAG: hypothetical protein ABI832_12255 [bacterium]